MLKQILFLFLGSCFFFATAQKKDSLSIKNGIENPSLLATHHFGIFSSRINTNFKYSAGNKNTLTLNYTTGNNFHPFVEAYFPKDPAVREILSQTIWHNRKFNFINQESTPADYMNIVVDAIIKEFRVSYSIPLNKHHEIAINLRSYLITKGKHPFSVFTSDESIEWFHSNIFGGEDPFGRRYYGLNQVNFKYIDRNGKTLELNNNDFFIGGLELNYYYYPKLKINKSKRIFINFGSHLGINTSQFNSSLDFGISLNTIKKFILKNNNEINFALGANVLKKNIHDFKTTMDLGTNPYLATFETNLEFTKYTQKGNFNAFGLNYQMQTRYNKKEEASYYHLRGKWQEINGGWHNGVAKLYNTLSNLNFTYTYGTPKFKLSLYFKEDFEVNNAPDFQTGIGLKIPVFN